MILSQIDLRQAVKDGRLAFNPPLEETQWGEASIDLRLGPQITKLRAASGTKVSVANGLAAIREMNLWDQRELRLGKDRMGKLDSYPLEQWEFVLGKTYETVSINCPDLIGFIEGRSTYARMGLSVHQAPWIQPGWDATITLEILNVGPLTIELVPIVDRLCQITFFELKTALEKDQLYGEKPGARYHHQKDALGST